MHYINFDISESRFLDIFINENQSMYNLIITDDNNYKYHNAISNTIYSHLP